MGLDYSINFAGSAISTIIVCAFIFGMGGPFVVGVIKLIICIVQSLYNRNK